MGPFWQHVWFLGFILEAGALLGGCSSPLGATQGPASGLLGPVRAIYRSQMPFGRRSCAKAKLLTTFVCLPVDLIIGGILGKCEAPGLPRSHIWAFLSPLGPMLEAMAILRHLGDNLGPY